MNNTETHDVVPLASSQKEIWLDHLAWPDSAHLNLGGVLEFQGSMSEPVLRQSLELLVEQNVALRLVPRSDGSQRVLRDFKPDLVVKDFTSSDDSAGACLQWQEQWMQQPFVIGERPPWRFAWLKASDTQYFIAIQFHHTIMDGWGTSVVSMQWAQNYTALSNNSRDQIEQADGQGVSYLDFIEESSDFRSSAQFAKYADFWKQNLNDLPEPVLDKKFRRKSVDTMPDAYVIEHSLERQAYAGIEAFSQSIGVTNYHILLAAIAIYFSKAYGRERIVLGAPNLNRSGKKYKSTIGMFITVMPLAIEVKPADTLLQVAQKIGKLLRSVYRYAKMPLSEVMREVKAIQQGKDRIFDIIVSYEKQEYECQFGAAKCVDSHQTFSSKARFPLGITLCEFHNDKDVKLVLEANEEYFSGAETQMLARRIERVLSQLASSPDMLVADVELIDAYEKKQLLEVLPDRVPQLTKAEPLITNFMRNAELLPDAIAFKTSEQETSYKEARGLAFKYANSMRARGVYKGDIVAVMLHRGPESVIAMVACHMIGAAFLTLDPDAPESRLEQIIADSDSKAIFTNVELAKRIEPHAGQAELIRLEQLTEQSPEHLELTPISGSDLAYVIYTSGTTGKPKGVEIQHEALARRILWTGSQWQINELDVIAQTIQLTFDPAILEIFLALSHGATIAFPPPGRLLPESLAQFCVDHQVTFIIFVPSVLQRFLDGVEDFSELKLRVVICGGEVLPAQLASRLEHHTGASVYNVYGPTEATILATQWLYSETENTFLKLPIGQPIADTSMHVLDQKLCPTPFGVPGDIYIGGACLAKGYLGNEHLTQAAFVTAPCLNQQRVYKTGDLGWMSLDGQVHFLGRSDSQVKFRGYRVELPEIEMALLDLAEVVQSAVKVIEIEGVQELAAWVSCSDRKLGVHELRQALARRLPDYMLPTKIAFVDELPLSTTGKIDYKALPLDFSSTSARQQRSAQGEVEQTLLTIWQQVLKKQDIQVHDNFFFIGGDSLAAVISLTRVEEELKIKLPLYKLVEYPTIAELATVINENLGDPKLVVSLGNTTRNKVLYIAASGHGDLLRFKALAKSLKGACDVHMLQPPSDDKELTFESLGELYAEQIAKTPHEEIYIAGFSIGGVTALETARALNNKGINTELLILIDTVFLKLPKLVYRAWQWLSWLTSKIKFANPLINDRKLSAILSDRGLYAQVEALYDYCPREYKRRTLLIRTVTGSWFKGGLFGQWKRTMGDNLIEDQVEGGHSSIFRIGNVEKLAETILKYIQENKN